MLFHWIEYQTEERGKSGRFTCPECGAAATYVLYHRYRHSWFVVLIIPISHSKTLFDETVRCTSCGASLSITVLAADAPSIASAIDAGAEGGHGVSTNLGNIVELSEAAVHEILRRFFSGKFKGKPIVRITPPLPPDEGYMVGFDYALADGRDWIGESHGIGIVVDRRDAPLLLGRIIDFRNGIFCEGKRTHHAPP
jgi:Fe-S cluster assembly iron-binding protein IscA/predicted RNA-binding Zn-ribbon protein involved in translation (DUF1610 family)